MTLNVPFHQFAKTLHRVLGVKDAYITPEPGGTFVSAANVEKDLLLVSRSELTLSAARAKLENSQCVVYEGSWLSAEGNTIKSLDQATSYIAAVAYKSGEATPGVWVDAFASLPTQIQVLRALYEEFRATGEVSAVSFEEFVRLSDPNVVILSPNDVLSFLEKKENCIQLPAD